jgi:hypothetical protein
MSALTRNEWSISWLPPFEKNAKATYVSDHHRKVAYPQRSVNPLRGKPTCCQDFGQPNTDHFLTKKIREPFKRSSLLPSSDGINAVLTDHLLISIICYSLIPSAESGLRIAVSHFDYTSSDRLCMKYRSEAEQKKAGYGFLSGRMLSRNWASVTWLSMTPVQGMRSRQ